MELWADAKFFRTFAETPFDAILEFFDELDRN